MAYKVEVTHEAGVWIADVLNLPGAHTEARSLDDLRGAVQEVIGLVLDRPEGDRFDVEFQFVDVNPDAV